MRLHCFKLSQRAISGTARIVASARLIHTAATAVEEGAARRRAAK